MNSKMCGNKENVKNIILIYFKPKNQVQ